MKVQVYKNYDEVSKAAAKIFAETVKGKENAVLGLATGSTPVGMYTELAKMYEAGEISFKNTKSFNLDEYVGIALSHPESYHSFMEKNLFSKIDIVKENTHVPYAEIETAEADCAAYDKAVQEAGGVDIQVLGIGGNGHIAFNEPDSEFPENTHIAVLDSRTIDDNARFFNSRDEVPTKAITVGMGVIMQAEKIIILATGENKADAVKKMVEGAIVPSVPASILRVHRNVTVLVDEAAASKLNK